MYVHCLCTRVLMQKCEIILMHYVCIILKAHLHRMRCVALRCVALRCRGAVHLVASLSPWHAAVYRKMPRTIAHVPKTQVNARGRVGRMSPHVIATHRSATHLCKRNLHGHHAFCFSSKISATGDVCASKRLTYLSNSWFR